MIAIFCLAKGGLKSSSPLLFGTSDGCRRHGGYGGGFIMSQNQI